MLSPQIPEGEGYLGRFECAAA